MVIVAAACNGLGPTSVGADSLAVIEAGSFDLVNQERSIRGVSPILSGDPQLAAIARAYSEKMRDEGFFSHISPSGETLGGRLARGSYGFSSAAENIARLGRSGNPAAVAHGLMMKNASHRGNILNPKFVRLGVGAAFRNDTVWITQVYVRPE